MYDLLIRGGRVLDGTGSPWYHADVAVTGPTIAAVGPLRRPAARRVVDAAGRCVTPGFIDMHTHSDLDLLAHPQHEGKILQGITTEVLGHDGLGLAPVTPATVPLLQEQLAGWNGRPAVTWDWTSLASYLARFDRQVAVNVAMLVPHGTVRLLVMGLDRRAPTAAELRRMQQLVVAGLREGAIGLSTGLTYVPGMFAGDDELVQLCRVMAPFGGFYCPHHRNYGMTALQAYADSIAIARQAGVPVHLTHCHLGYPQNRGRAPELLAAIDQARADGVEVTLDSYPYLAGQTYLASLLPGWAQEGGPAATLARLAAPDTRQRLRHELEVAGSEGFHGVPLGWDLIGISGVAEGPDRASEGLRLDVAAARAGQAPFDFFCDLLVRTRLEVSCLAFIGNEENVRTILGHPAHMVGSDGILVGTRPHPRGWGSHARFLAHYVRDLGLLSWEEGIRKITAAPARRIGAWDRGLIRPGLRADLVVFDPATLRDTATYDDPRRVAVGVDYVAVNGVLVVDGGRVTGATPGRALRRGARGIQS
ncbi:MAG TPA: D-aminoacylase [Chloroflexia bacterium]|nr:D-aminoacylase [Chloroflexia bacterium]